MSRLSLARQCYQRLEIEPRVGELSPCWNHLVGEYDKNPEAKIAHFTLGTPCFEGYEDQEFADEWFAEYESMLEHK